MSAGRFYTAHERGVLFELADGKCEMCGMPLDETFHADHYVPFSAGGKTTIDNGQALCPPCNLKKGATVPHRTARTLRRWQQQALDKFGLTSDHVFVVEACPGAGKTTFALECAIRGGYDRLYVLSHTSFLQRQWHVAAGRVGLDLSIGSSMAGRDGASWTMQYVDSNSGLAEGRIIRDAARNAKCLLVIDEVHHLGQNKSWGTATQPLVEAADRVLVLTGTPFRHDSNPIAFCEYAGDPATLVKHHTYGYKDALRDNVVLPIEFVFQTATGRWVNNSTVAECLLHEAGNDADMSKALRSAVRHDSEWVKATCEKAVQDLVKIRRDMMPTAALLFVADSKQDAEKVGPLLSRMLNTHVPVVTEDNARAEQDIQAFVDSGLPAIVAVNMISEGVDIPRLKIGIHATTTRTELFVRQLVGRFTRTSGNRQHDSVHPQLYMPAVSTLLDHARMIEDERDHVLGETEDRHVALRDESPIGLSETMILPSTNPELHTAVRSGTGVSPEEIAEVEEIRTQAQLLIGRPMAYNDVAVVMKLTRDPHRRSTTQEAGGATTWQSPQDQRDQLRRELTHLLNEAVRRQLPWALGYDGDTPHAFLHIRLRDTTDGTAQADASAEVLQQRIKYLKLWLDRMCSV